MIMHEELRREILKSLYSAERLFYCYKKSAIFQEQPSRLFMDKLWHTVSTGEAPPITLEMEISKYIRSDKVPSENECFGIDRYGYSFILALETITNFLDGHNPKILELVYLDIETSNIDGIIIDSMIEDHDTIVITQEVRNTINSHPLMLKLSKQLEIDSAKANSIALTPSEIEASKFGSIYDITLWTDLTT